MRLCLRARRLRKPRQRAHRRGRCARAATRSICWRRCCGSKPSPTPISARPPWPAILLTSANGARALAAPSPARRADGAAGAGGGQQQRRGCAGRGLCRCRFRRRRRAAISRGSLPNASPARKRRCSISPARIASGELDGAGRRGAHRRGLSRRQGRAFPGGGAQCAWCKDEIDGVLHFSRRSVEAYVECAGRCRRSGAWRRCIIACRRGPPSRCGGPERRIFASRRTRTRRACSLWSRQSRSRIV